MDTRKLHEQAEVLERLHQWHLTGENAPTLSPEMQNALLAERFIHLDEFGDVQISERGEEQLLHLKAEGRLRRRRNPPAVKKEPPRFF